MFLWRTSIFHQATSLQELEVLKSLCQLAVYWKLATPFSIRLGYLTRDMSHLYCITSHMHILYIIIRIITYTYMYKYTVWNYAWLEDSAGSSFKPLTRVVKILGPCFQPNSPGLPPSHWLSPCNGEQGGGHCCTNYTWNCDLVGWDIT